MSITKVQSRAQGSGLSNSPARCAKGAYRAYIMYVTLKDDDRVRVVPFDAIEFSLGDLWG